MTEDRVFVQVALPDDDTRCFQLQPNVKLHNVIRSLQLNGVLYFGEHRVDASDTPASLGLQPGIDNCAEFQFVPAITTRAGSDTAASSAAPSTSQAANKEGHHADVEALLRIVKNRSHNFSGTIASISSLQPSVSAQRHPTVIEAETIEVPPVAYNPRVNTLRETAVHSANLEDAVTYNKLPSVNGGKAALDRPSRKSLPIERRHGDTVVPHTPWPQDPRTFALVTSEPVTHHSPHLQGAGRTRHSDSETSATMSSHEERPVSLSRSAALDDNVSVQPATADAAVSQDCANDILKRLSAVEAALEHEREHRLTLEKRVEWLMSLLPNELVVRSAELEHHRLMHELKEQRTKTRVL